ncbi:MAG TPA: hypothetical protein VFI10_04455 [Gaiellaceae bacterium]|jgi:hypothetical protein|nr:hypothetical protein [Gaiellaceae bacterium]
METRQERLAANEALFRTVNEHIRDAAAAHGDDPHAYEFLCECSNTDCDLRLTLPLATYETVRSNPARFIVAPGHHLPDIESIIAERQGYTVIEKDTEAARRLVSELDPRRP